MIKRFLTLINFVFVLTCGELIYAQAPSDTTTLREAGFHVDFRWDKAVLLPDCHQTARIRMLQRLQDDRLVRGAISELGHNDLQWDKKICTQGEYWSLGASAGYVMPVGEDG